MASEGAIADIWPGFWTQHQSFALILEDDRLLLIKPVNGNSCGATPIPQTALPAALRGRALYAERPAGSRANAEIEVRVGTCIVPAVPVVAPAAGYRTDGARVAWFGDSVATQVMLTVHETFHSFQGDVFRGRPNGLGAFADPRDLSEHIELLKSDEFHAKLTQERAELLAAVQASSADVRWAAVRRYLSLRKTRLDALTPRLRSFEDNHERAEGVANWVGYEAARLAAATTPDGVRQAIISDFTSEWLDSSGKPYTGVERFRRWHLYLVGTAKAWLLDQFGPPTWKREITDGAALDDLLARVTTGAGW